MHNNCEYCGKPFKAKRATRKYCSDNCKQLAYFKRNGMVFGMNGTKMEDTVKDFTLKPIVKNTVKELNDKPDSVKPSDNVKTVSPVNVKQTDSVKELYAKPDNIKQFDNVKQSGNVKENISLLSERQMQELIYRISLSLDSKIEQVIANVKKELDVKYASLYGKEVLTQNTTADILSCSPVPFMGVTKYESDPVVKHEPEAIVKPAVKDESGAIAEKAENTTIESEEHFTVNDKKEILQTLSVLELSDDEPKNEPDCESEEKEGYNELYEMTSEENTVKQNSVKHDTESMSAEQNDKDKYKKELQEKLEALTLKAEQELQENTVAENEVQQSVNKKPMETEQQDEPKDQPQAEAEPEYEWVHSKFLKDIENDFEESNGFDFWDSGNADIDWVNIRLHCVMENIVRLSEYNTIDRHSILQLNDALDKIVNNDFFINLPSDYPYKQITREVAERMSELAQNANDNISLRINLKTKARLASMCYQMKDNVPLLKFNELDFGAAHSSELERTGKKKKKKSGSWKTRYKELVQAGEIKDEDFDEEEDGEEDEDDMTYSRSGENPYMERFKYFEQKGKFPAKRAA